MNAVGDQRRRSEWPAIHRSLGATLLDRIKKVGDDFLARLRAEVAFAVHAHADGAGFHVAVADHEHGVDFHLLGAGDLGLDVVAARRRARRGLRGRAVRL